MKTPVGIEALAVALPRRTLHLEDLARARGVDPAKYIAGLGVREMAVTDPGEDTVALAATAVRRLIDADAIDPASIGMLAVGTESSVDHSKPIASFVHGMVGLPRHMRGVRRAARLLRRHRRAHGSGRVDRLGVAGGKSAIVSAPTSRGTAWPPRASPRRAAARWPCWSPPIRTSSPRPRTERHDAARTCTTSGARWVAGRRGRRPLLRRLLPGGAAGAYRDWRDRRTAKESSAGAVALPSEQLAAHRLPRPVLQDGEEGPRRSSAAAIWRTSRRVDDAA